MNIVLQIWGGGFYLLSKILLSRAQGKADNKSLKIGGWVFYLLGVPAWFILLATRQDWMAATIEVGGIPSMLLGLFIAVKGLKTVPTKLDRIAMGFSYVMLFIGVGYSIHEYNGIRTLSQILEIGVIVGFLSGTYLLAKENRSGWLFFMVMNISMALLMLMRGNLILTAQQIVSLYFIWQGYRRSSIKLPKEEPL